jgi:hypothetical protein
MPGGLQNFAYARQSELTDVPCTEYNVRYFRTPSEIPGRCGRAVGKVAVRRMKIFLSRNDQPAYPIERKKIKKNKEILILGNRPVAHPEGSR